MKRRAYFNMMKRFGIVPHKRQLVVSHFVEIKVLDPIDVKNGMKLGQRFEVLEVLDGAYRIRVPFRDFSYPIPMENVTSIVFANKRHCLKQVA